MPNYNEAPDHILVEFFRPTGEAVRLGELGDEFLFEVRASREVHEMPFAFAMAKRENKAGNAFYRFQQDRIQLPDGLHTIFRVGGEIVPQGVLGTAPQTGNPKRESSITINLDDFGFIVKVYISKPPGRYYLSIDAG